MTNLPISSHTTQLTIYTLS